MNIPTFAPGKAPSEYETIGNMIRQSHEAHDKASATPRWRPFLRARRLRQADHLQRQATNQGRAYLNSLPRA